MRAMTMLAALVTALGLAMGTGTHAAEPRGGGDKGGKGKPKVIELEALVIEGKVAKPQVFYVLGRSRVQYENLKMQRVFVDKIVEDAKKNPF